MKYVVIILNLLLLGFVTYLLIEDGFPSRQSGLWLVILLTVLPVVNLIYAVRRDSSNSWLALYFRRKAAEERKKLKALEDGEQQEP